MRAHSISPTTSLPKEFNGGSSVTSSATSAASSFTASPRSSASPPHHRSSEAANNGSSTLKITPVPTNGHNNVSALSKHLAGVQPIAINFTTSSVEHVATTVTNSIPHTTAGLQFISTAAVTGTKMVNGAAVTKIVRHADKDGDHQPPKKVLKLSSNGSVTVSQVVVTPIQVFNNGNGMQASSGGLATIELSTGNGKTFVSLISA